MCLLANLWTEYVCGHQQVRERVGADCHKKKCALSANHDENDHDCIQSCAQR
ncbi:hypothetical protein K525DRAFT_163805, partial [Schizophyllum commune Loenen D]